jgi:hypothetical protein
MGGLAVDGPFSGKILNFSNSVKATAIWGKERQYSMLNFMLYMKPPPRYSLLSYAVWKCISALTTKQQSTPLASTNRTTNIRDEPLPTLSNSDCWDGRFEQYGVLHTATFLATTVPMPWQSKVRQATLHANMQPPQRLGS